MVYSKPPAINNTIPFGPIILDKLLKSNTINQPITKYSNVENELKRPVKNSFKTTPKVAIPQTVKNNVHPKLCSKVISKTGVYVPAIKR